MQHAPVSMDDPRAMAPEELLDNAGALRALGRRLVADPEDAEDVVQTAYLRALERRPKGRLGTWLWVVVRNEARMLRRRASRRRRSEQLRRTADGAPDPADLACRLAMQRRLVECIEELEPIYRQVVYLRWFEEMPPRAIAALLGVPRKTVETRLRRALANLRSKLDRKYGSREEWLGAVGAYWGNGAATAPFWIGALLMNTKTVFTSSAILAVGLVVFMVARSEPAPPGAAPEPAVGPAMATVASPDDTDIDPESLSRSSVRPDRAPAGTGELLTGAVVDERSNPVGGLPLRFEPEQQGHWADPGPVVTEPDGSFAIGRPGVSGRILADDPAWTTLLAGTTTWDDRPVWVVVAGAARIAGTVVHADGSPVPAVRVVVELPVGFRTRFDFPLENSEDRSWKGLTDDRGFFQLADVPLMEGCRITWTKTDYAPEKRELRRDERELHVVLRPLVAEGGELRGVVVDDRGQPVSGAQVALGREVRRTREDGSFTFLVDPGADRLLAVAEGWMPVVLRREPPGWPAYVELRFARRPMSLSGRVLDEAGMAHGNALVWVEDLTYFGAALTAEHDMQGSNRVWRAVATDGQGRFEIPGLMDREYRVRAIDKRTALMTASGTARAGTTSKCACVSALQQPPHRSMQEKHSNYSMPPPYGGTPHGKTEEKLPLTTD